VSVDTRAPGTAPDVSSVRLLATMAVTGAVAGLLVVLSYTATTPVIIAHRKAILDVAIREVLPGIARYETLSRDGTGLTTSPPEDGTDLETVYAGIASDGHLVGFAIVAREPGFQDPIDLLFGYDPRSDAILGLAILSSRETPGLGNKIQDPEWRAQFGGARAPVQARKRGATTPGEVQMITGATISSRAVIAAINKTVERWRPVLVAHARGGTP
jgi:electron transport complex protein RnfG